MIRRCCYTEEINMYLIVLQDYKIKVVCQKCYDNGKIIVDDCTMCGGKGVHNKGKQKWEVFKHLTEINKIDRDEKGELRFWSDKSSYFPESMKLVHFTYQDALAECKRRNNELT